MRLANTLIRAVISVLTAWEDCMSKTAFLELLDELFELDPGTISGSDELQQIHGWSSLTFVGLIAMVDEECGLTLAPKSLLACKSVDDLVGLLDGHIRAAA